MLTATAIVCAACATTASVLLARTLGDRFSASRQTAPRVADVIKPDAE